MIQAFNLVQLKTAQDVIETDLHYICTHLTEEFASLSGKQLLITGGAGFLGYYLVQSVLQWNTQHMDLAPIQLTIVDNCIRGIPEWLTNLESDP